MGDGEEVTVEIRDEEDVLENYGFGRSISMHADGEAADACGKD
jgi:hypothetical protein